MTDYTKKFGYTPKYMNEMTPPNTARCMCPACGLFFKSIKGFDMHRRDGKCLSTQEMRDKGMDTNKTGHWISRKMASDPTGFTIDKTSNKRGA